MLMEEERLADKKILITPQGMSALSVSFNDLFGSGYEVEFTNGLITDAAKLKSLLKNKDACIIGSEAIDDSLLNDCNNLKIISRFGSGYDSISLNDLKKRNIALAIASQHSTEAVSRHTLSLILSLTNNIVKQKDSVRSGIWDRTLNLSSEETEIGLIGMGEVAKKLSTYLLMLGFGVKYFSRSRHYDVEDLGVKYVPTIERLISLSNIISIHLKHTHETKNTINEKMINLLEGKYLVNTARGGLVDEKKLFHALIEGKIKGAALDVYHSEPADKNTQALQSLNNVVATCHVSAYDYVSIQKVGEQAINNIKNYFSGDYAKVNLVY